MFELVEGFGAGDAGAMTGFARFNEHSDHGVSENRIAEPRYICQ